MFTNPMIRRSETFYNGTPIDPANLGGANLPGRIWQYEDDTYGTNVPIFAQCVRNNAGFAIKAKRLVLVDANYNITGYALADGSQSFPVDDLLTFDVPVGDLTLVILQGPCLIKSPTQADGTNVINKADWLMSRTSAISTAGDATHGRVTPVVFQSPTNAAAAKANFLISKYAIGQALSALTTSNSDADVLTMVNIRF